MGEKKNWESDALAIEPQSKTVFRCYGGLRRRMGLLIRTQGAPSMILAEQLVNYHPSLSFQEDFRVSYYLRHFCVFVFQKGLFFLWPLCPVPLSFVNSKEGNFSSNIDILTPYEFRRTWTNTTSHEHNILMHHFYCVLLLLVVYVVYKHICRGTEND